jgi:hypothetical protein
MGKKQKKKLKKKTTPSSPTNNEDPLRVCLRKNKVFFGVLLLCLYAISRYTQVSLLNAVLTMIFISASGYFTHVLAHRTNFRQMYESQDCYLAKSYYLDSLIRWLCKAADFHDEIHHDSNINKQWDNIAYEFVLNLLTQGGLVLVFVYILKQCSYSVIILWALLYATVHNINYNIVHPSTHRDHHYKKTTNYGMDFYDIFFNSKFDIADIEDQNHGAINLVVLTVIILYLNSSTS